MVPFTSIVGEVVACCGGLRQLNCWNLIHHLRWSGGGAQSCSVGDTGSSGLRLQYLHVHLHRDRGPIRNCRE